MWASKCDDTRNHDKPAHIFPHSLLWEDAPLAWESHPAQTNRWWISGWIVKLFGAMASVAHLVKGRTITLWTHPVRNFAARNAAATNEPTSQVALLNPFHKSTECWTVFARLQAKLLLVQKICTYLSLQPPMYSFTGSTLCQLGLRSDWGNCIFMRERHVAAPYSACGKSYAKQMRILNHKGIAVPPCAVYSTTQSIQAFHVSWILICRHKTLVFRQQHNPHGHLHPQIKSYSPNGHCQCAATQV